MPACTIRDETADDSVESGAGAAREPEPMNTDLGERAHKPVFVVSGPGLRAVLE
jgi:hypothetical protein